MDCLDLYTWISGPSYEWDDEAYIQWGICFEDDLSPLRQVWVDQNYAYGATASGLNIIDLETNSIIAYTYEETGFTTLWGSNDIIYLGTLDDGVKYIEKSSISGTENSPNDLTSFVESYNYYYNVGSTNIKYIHGNNNTLAVVTSNGIDILNNEYTGYKSSLSNTNVTKCFLTSNCEVYYIIQEPSVNKVAMVNTCLCDWTLPDTVYLNDGTIIGDDVGITDIFVTTNTSISGGSNTMFIATSSGAYVVDEDSLGYDNYTTSLAGTSFELTGIWSDKLSSRNTGKMYTVSSNSGAALSVVELSSGILYDKYTIIQKGRANKVLSSEDIVDLVVESN